MLERENYSEDVRFVGSSVFKHFISTVTKGWLTTIVSPTFLDASHSARVSLDKIGIKSLS